MHVDVHSCVHCSCLNMYIFILFSLSNVKCVVGFCLI